MSEEGSKRIAKALGEVAHAIVLAGALVWLGLFMHCAGTSMR